ncbi:hypothetical protein DF162_34725, partial [Burkholderia stagnalis]
SLGVGSLGVGSLGVGSLGVGSLGVGASAVCAKNSAYHLLSRNILNAARRARIRLYRKTKYPKADPTTSSQ